MSPPPLCPLDTVVVVSSDSWIVASPLYFLVTAKTPSRVQPSCHSSEQPSPLPPPSGSPPADIHRISSEGGPIVFYNGVKYASFTPKLHSSLWANGPRVLWTVTMRVSTRG